MRTEHLEYLIGIAKFGSISAASQMLFVSPQGISSAISRLEHELGIVLLNRTRQGATLTAEGTALASAGADFLSTVKKLQDDFLLQTAPSSARVSGHISFCYAPIFGDDFLSSFIPEFYSSHPDIHLTASELDAEHLIHSIANNEYDFGLAAQLFQGVRPIWTKSDYAAEFSADIFHYITLYSEPVIAMASRDLPIASRPTVSIRELMEYPMTCSPKAAISQYILSNLHSYGTPNIYMNTDSIPASYAMVSRGLCIMLTTNLGVRNYLQQYKNVVMIPITEQITCNYCILIKREKKLSRASQMFISQFMEKFTQRI